MYGSNYVSTKLLQERVPPSMVTFCRFALASLFFIPSILKSNTKMTLKILLSGIELGIWCGIGFISQAVALQHVSASKAAFSCGLAVLMPPLFDILYYHYKRMFQLKNTNNNNSNNSNKNIIKSSSSSSSLLLLLRNPFLSPLLALTGVSILEWNGLSEPCRLEDVFLLIPPIGIIIIIIIIIIINFNYHHHH